MVAEEGEREKERQTDEYGDRNRGTQTQRETKTLIETDICLCSTRQAETDREEERRSIYIDRETERKGDRD